MNSSINPRTAQHALSSIFLVAMLLLSLITPSFATEEAASARLDLVLDLKPDVANGQKLYLLCAACHGKSGAGELNGEFPAIAGQHQRVLIKQLLDIQTKKRINPTMFPFVDAQTLGGDQGLADVTAHVAALTLNDKPIHGPGTSLAEGEELYMSQCVVCHGESGDGNASALYPRLRGQHFSYLLRELSWIKSGIRKNGDPTMVAILQTLSEANIAALADYITTLKLNK